MQKESLKMFAHMLKLQLYFKKNKMPFLHLFNPRLQMG